MNKEQGVPIIAAEYPFQTSNSTTERDGESKAENEGIVDVLVSIFSNYAWTASRITNAWSEIDSAKDKVFARIINVKLCFSLRLHAIDFDVSVGIWRCSRGDIEEGHYHSL